MDHQCQIALNQSRAKETMWKKETCHCWSQNKFQAKISSSGLGFVRWCVYICVLFIVSFWWAILL